MNTCRGFTLLELTISCFLASVLMAFFMQQVFQFKRQSQVMHHQMNETMEIQWLIDFMRSRVYKAGFTPCRQLEDLIRIDTRAKPGTLRSIELNAKQDGFLLHHMDDDVLQIESQMNASTFRVHSTHIKKEHPVLVSDCYHAEVHTVAQVSHQGDDTVIVLKEPLIYDYPKPFYLGEWVTEAFFLRNIGDNKALFYQYHRVDQLMPHVRSFKVKLGKARSHFLLNLKLTLDTLRTVEIDIRGRNA
jgi:hypothetical protein